MGGSPLPVESSTRRRRIVRRPAFESVTPAPWKRRVPGGHGRPARFAMPRASGPPAGGTSAFPGHLDSCLWIPACAGMTRVDGTPAFPCSRRAPASDSAGLGRCLPGNGASRVPGRRTRQHGATSQDAGPPRHRASRVPGRRTRQHGATSQDAGPPRHRASRVPGRRTRQHGAMSQDAEPSRHRASRVPGKRTRKHGAAAVRRTSRPPRPPRGCARPRRSGVRAHGRGALGNIPAYRPPPAAAAREPPP